MIKLEKEPTPPSLTVDAAALTEEYISNPKATPWKRRDLLEALQRETRAKCAYCENKVAASAWTHVEHILPKSKFPHLVVEWANLTLACPKCNIFKGDYHSDDVPLINPYLDEPERRLVFAFGIVRPVPGDASSEATVRLLRLHRFELTELRQGAVAKLESLVSDWRRASEPFKEPILEEIRAQVNDDAPFVGSLRAYLRLVGHSELV